MKGIMKTITTLVIGMALGATTIAAAAPSTVQAVVANLKILVNGEEQALKSSPLVVNGTTYLPLREVAGLLDSSVQYDGNTKQIQIQTKGDQTVTAQTQEWFKVSELVDKYGIKVTISETTTVSYNDAVIEFPFSMYDKKAEGKTFTNKENTASIKITSDGILIGKDTLNSLGVQ